MRTLRNARGFDFTWLLLAGAGYYAWKQGWLSALFGGGGGTGGGAYPGGVVTARSECMNRPGMVPYPSAPSAQLTAATAGFEGIWGQALIYTCERRFLGQDPHDWAYFRTYEQSLGYPDPGATAFPEFNRM